MAILEQALFMIKEGKFRGTLSDSIASTSAGLILLFPKYFSQKIF